VSNCIAFLAPFHRSWKDLLLKQHYGKWFDIIQVYCIPKNP
jgi:hypothetical protein